ncbi:MAG: energy-coupled thiamine transporter ThiT [Lachnospiraceae bacterium]|nr:energy-coupled thiamine transporter ThiT [Lachnospiraceae bacterium]
MQKNNIKIMAEGAAIVALSTVLSYIRVFKLPWGGSITLLSMLPIVVFSIRRGVKAGLTAAFAFSLLQFLQGVLDGIFGWGLTPGMLTACIFLDYIGAFTVLGIAGIFRKKELSGWIMGISLAIVLRFLFHFCSGVVIWHSVGTLWSGFATENTYLYSFLYNGCYMLPELVFTLLGAVALLKAPQTSRLLLSQD